MKFWTVQKNIIINTIDTYGYFKPDFSKSDYTASNPPLTSLYNMILEAFNNVNNTNYAGLIFAFAQTDNKNIYPIPDIYSFYDLIKEKKSVIKSLWDNLSSKDVVIAELDYLEDDFNFNPISIDINDFQFLMPPHMILPPYTKNDISRICNDLYNGNIKPSIFPSGIIQAHLPFITSKNLTNVYPMFKLK